MKGIIRLIVLIACGTALFTHVRGQERSSQITPTYQFEYKLTSKSDTSTTLYCVINAVDIVRFVKIHVTYNDKIRQYFTKNILKDNSAEFFLQYDKVYIRIMEELNEPFVFIEGEDRMGRKIAYNEKSANGKTINPWHELENWKNWMARIDSMDFVRKDDFAFAGKAGTTTYQNKMTEADGSSINQSLSAQQTVSLTPSKDAYLYMTMKPGYEYYATTNFGTSTKFYSGEWSASNYRVNQRSVMDFDVASIPADAVILEAKLSLYSMYPQTNDDYRHTSSLIKPNSVYKSNASYIERITTGWTESAVTYNTQPATSTSHRLLLQESRAYDQNYTDFDVTGMVQDMLNNPGESYGFMLRLENETKYSRMAFCSREFPDTARWPRLVVKYTISDKLSTFYSHSFVLKTDGSLWAWGGNLNGQIGDGTTTDRYSQVQIGTKEWKQISAGYNHTLAIKTDGSLWAWGFNIIGQLGDGTNVEKHSPVRIGTASNWKLVSAGYNYSVAIRTDGTLWAWGFNDKGQLGIGSTTVKNAPVKIGTSSDWKMVVARNNFTLAIKKDSTLWAWGSNDHGQLGDGTTIDKLAPVQIGTDKDWKTISAGWDHALALRYNGTLWAWGRDNYGQLGDSTKTNRLSPMMVDNSSDWKDISAGNQHSLATKADGTLWSWGYNYYGQLGNGSDGNAVFTPTPVEGMANCMQVAAGCSYSLILNPDGSYCGTGINNSGQLGDGSTTNRFSFACVSPYTVSRTIASGAAIEESAIAMEEVDTQKPYVEQNYPNPSAGITTIDCYVTDNAGDARLVVYNMSGIIVHQYPIANKGNCNVTLDLQNLPSGIYFYGMMIDGRNVSDKKRLVLIKQ
jgi:alpha-tubulin suppressor-like RCC1 family protein